MENNFLERKIINCAIEVHKHIGPGLLEKTYEECLAHEFIQRRIYFERQKKVSVIYKGLCIKNCYRLDFLIEDKIILEIKSIKRIMPLHLAQTIAYLRACKLNKGLILNFNVPLMRDGIKSVVA
jgi:GxxExxY protein